MMWVVGAVVEVAKKQRLKKAATKKAGLVGTRHPKGERWGRGTRCDFWFPIRCFVVAARAVVRARIVYVAESSLLWHAQSLLL